MPDALQRTGQLLIAKDHSTPTVSVTRNAKTLLQAQVVTLIKWRCQFHKNVGETNNYGGECFSKISVQCKHRMLLLHCYF